MNTDRQLQRMLDTHLGRLHLDQHCGTCGGISRTTCSVLLRSASEEVRHCAECGVPIDQEGRAVGRRMPDGRVFLKQIVLADDPQPAPASKAR